MAVQEYLAALRKNPDSQAAGAYDDEGRLVGQFRLSGTPPPKTGRLIPPLIVDRDLIVTARVAQGDTSLGSVYLRSSLERWPRRGPRLLGTALRVLSDRKSDVAGKRWYISVKLGGRRYKK